MKFKKLVRLTLIAISMISAGLSQTDLEINLGKILNPSSTYNDDYVKNYLKGYMQPFVTAFGTCVSGAMYHRATVKEFPRFDIGISAVYLSVPDESKYFKDPGNNTVPTIFGKTEAPAHDNTLPGGIGLNSILAPQLQVNLGLVSNFEVTARYLNFNIKQFGDLTFTGLGVKYGFGEFAPVFPIDLSVQAMYHKFVMGDWLDSGTIGMNLHLSKKILLTQFEIYGGIGFENTTMLIKTVSFPINNLRNVDNISIDGENNFRFNLGLSWTLTFFNIHADYNFGKYNSLSFGSMIVL